MANELHVAAMESGWDVYGVIFNLAGQVDYYDGGAGVFEAYGNGGHDADDYNKDLVDKGGGMYVGDFDANITDEGDYIVKYFRKLGANPADDDEYLGAGNLYWSGLAELSELLYKRAGALRGGKAIQNTGTGTISYYAADGVTLIYTETETDNGDGTVTVEVTAV